MIMAHSPSGPTLRAYSTVKMPDLEVQYRRKGDPGQVRQKEPAGNLTGPPKGEQGREDCGPRVRISARAIPGAWSPKNKIDHKTLSTSWPPNNARGRVTNDSLWRRHTNHPAIAIPRYSTDHTGPNSQFGGVKEGLTKLPYHSGIEGVVKVDPTSAAPKQAATNASNARAERAGPLRLRFLVLPTIVPPHSSSVYQPG